MTTAHLRGTVRATCAAVLAAGSLVLCAPAGAAPPDGLAEDVTDRAGVLDGTGRELVDRALDDLADDTGLRLHVVYVDSFDGLPPAEWADRTAEASGLGPTEILLAVAVVDRQYHVAAHDDVRLSDEALRDVEANCIEPALRADHWDGAAVSAAACYRDEALWTDGSDAGGSEHDSPIGALVLVAAVAGIVALVLLVGWAIRRRGVVATTPVPLGEAGATTRLDLDGAGRGGTRGRLFGGSGGGLLGGSRGGVSGGTGRRSGLSGSSRRSSGRRPSPRRSSSRRRSGRRGGGGRF